MCPIVLQSALGFAMSHRKCYIFKTVKRYGMTLIGKLHSNPYRNTFPLLKKCFSEKFCKFSEKYIDERYVYSIKWKKWNFCVLHTAG